MKKGFIMKISGRPDEEVSQLPEKRYFCFRMVSIRRIIKHPVKDSRLSNITTRMRGLTGVQRPLSLEFNDRIIEIKKGLGLGSGA